MARWLKQSTSVTLPIGPFVDRTNGADAETGITLANTDIRLWKHGASVFANKNSGGGTHLEKGYYSITLNATDTDTLGPLRLICDITATALPIWEEFLVVTANVWDTLYGADVLLAEPVAASGTAPADIAAGIAAKVIETQGSYTVQQALSIMLAVLAGQTSNNGATLSSPNGVATRVTATVDANNNRTAMTLNPSA